MPLLQLPWQLAPPDGCDFVPLFYKGGSYGWQNAPRWKTDDDRENDDTTLAPAVPPPVPVVPTVTASNTSTMQYSYNADPCRNKDETLSDSPARAFRNASGAVHLYSSESRGARASVGAELNGEAGWPGLKSGSLTRDCAVFYNS
eukprot:SAG22_NODE_2351_length_2677_cov_5.504267_2_plen_145_part_00